MEIGLEANILVWGHRVIVPGALQKNILKELHMTHLGIVKMKSFARSYVWWPSLNEEIEELCKSCIVCSKFRSSPPRTELRPWPVPDAVWERLHMDFLGPINGKMFWTRYPSGLRFLR